MSGFLFSQEKRALTGKELSKFNGEVINQINNAKECLYPDIERREYVASLINRAGLSEFYNSCFLAILRGYRKKDVSDAVAAALEYIQQITQLTKYTGKIVDRCTKIEKCLEKYDSRLRSSGKDCSWFHLDLLLANIVDFSEIVIKETADDRIRAELQGLLLRVRHMRVILPQDVLWDEYITKEKEEAAIKGFNLQSEGSANFLEISIFRLVYASRATFPKHPDKTVKLNDPALLSILGVPSVRDFYLECGSIILGKKTEFKDFRKKTEAMICSMDLDKGLKKKLTATVFPTGSFEDFLASDYSKSLFFFERVLGGFVRFLNEYYKTEYAKDKGSKLVGEIHTFGFLLLALIVLHTHKGMPKK